MAPRPFYAATCPRHGGRSGLGAGSGPALCSRVGLAWDVWFNKRDYLTSLCPPGSWCFWPAAALSIGDVRKEKWSRRAEDLKAACLRAWAERAVPWSGDRGDDLSPLGGCVADPRLGGGSRAGYGWFFPPAYSPFCLRTSRLEPEGLKEEFLGKLCAVFLVRGCCPDVCSRWSSFPAREHRFLGGPPLVSVCWKVCACF